MIICLFKGHNWSQWYNRGTEDKQYRYCIRCGATEEKIGLVVVKKRNILNWLISLTKPSFKDSIDEAVREGQQQWFNRIPRDELNDAIKCLANELSKKDFDSLGLFLVGCGYCRNRNFCGDIIHSMEKAFKKYERKEKVQKRGG
jgi:hypothetical protein